VPQSVLSLLGRAAGPHLRRPLYLAQLREKTTTADGVKLHVTAFSYSDVDGSTFDITFSSVGPRVVRAAAAAAADVNEGEVESEDEDGHDGADVDNAAAVQTVAEQLEYV